MREIEAIYRDGAHYDRLFGRGYFEFWLSQAKIRGGPVLELGCGTGKLSIPLAQAGYSVVGLDTSTALLRFAASKNGSVKWIEGDMRGFDLDEKFALIMLPSNNLGHLHTPEDVENCFRSVRRHLKPDGVLVIDVFVPNVKLLLRNPEEEYLLDEYDNPEGEGRVRVMARSHYESTTQIMRTTTIRKTASQPDVIGSLDLKMYFPRELEALVRCNGLRLVERYGGHAMEPFDETSRFQILVCENSNG
ncbi:MAG TPA: class I SAM-dependent methyltransferase [Terriglobia bacterium]|nr:class I SAM-dependent methyltransferase [Terriglobia bacterium]